MPTLIAGVVAVILLYSLLQMFRAAIPLGIFGAGLLGWSPFGASGFSSIGGIFSGSSSQRSPGQTSRVRSQFLDMILDHDSGELSGQIVAGPYAGRSLGEFDLAQLTAMISSFDTESVSLLESYLDRRFPAWRENAQGRADGGQARSAASGKMTNEEAYQILGLQPGAGRDEIGRAHRALMK